MDGDRLVPGALGGVGGLLAVVVVIDVVLRAAGVIPAPVSGEFLVGVVTSFPFALFLIGVGYWLHDGPIEPKRHARIATWTLVATAFFAAFFSLVAMLVFETWWIRMGVLRWGLSVGAGGGCLVGVFEARAIEQEVAAERASVRAAEAERRHELLDYLNELLRHEVLNTANVIDGYAHRIEAGDDDSREHARTIRARTEDMTAVIEEVRILLETSNDEAGLEPIDLERVVREQEGRLHDKYDRVETTVDLPEASTVLADGQLGRLFANLFENAVEYNDSATPSVTVHASRTDEAVVVEVSDNGVGISADRRDRLFDRSTRQTASHGLGLAVVQALAQRYRGSVELAATGPSGSRFTITLPRAASTPEDPDGRVDPERQSIESG